MKRYNGFTIVEIIVIIVVIGILAAIVALGLNQYRIVARDNQRSSSISTITEALEKYYDEHGEYPSCAAITSSAADVAKNTLKGIDSSTLLVPNADPSITNSISCNQTLNVNGAEFIQYVGDGSSDCTGSVACRTYKLRYLDEKNGIIKEVSSRRAASVATSGTSTLKAGPVTYTTGGVSWTPVVDALNYTLQRSTSSSFTSPTSYTIPSGTLMRQFTDMGPGITEYFRIKAATSGGDTAWSNTAQVTPTALTAPTLTNTQNNPQQVTESWTSVAGAAAYTIQRSTTTDFSSGVNTNSTAGNSQVYSDTPIGSARSYRVQGTVTNTAGTTFGGPWSNVITYTSFVPQPNADPAVKATLSGTNAIGSIPSTVTCTQGATPTYRLREAHKSNSASADSWTAWTAWGANTITQTVAAQQGFQHKFQSSAACLYAGSYSTDRQSGTDAVVRNIDKPASPTWPAGLSKTWAGNTYGHVMNYGTSCPAGTWVSTNYFSSRAWPTATPRDYTHTFGYDDYWLIAESSPQTVEYWAGYKCGTSYTESVWTDDYYTTITVNP